MEGARKKGFGSVSLKKDEEVRYEDFTVKAKSFSTAGKRLIKFSKFLEEKEKTIKDEELKKFCQKLRKKIREDFVKMVENIKEADVSAEKLGEDAQLRKEMLFYILQPSQYKHIPKYLKFKCGSVVS